VKDVINYVKKKADFRRAFTRGTKERMSCPLVIEVKSFQGGGETALEGQSCLKGGGEGIPFRPAWVPLRGEKKAGTSERNGLLKSSHRIEGRGPTRYTAWLDVFATGRISKGTGEEVAWGGTLHQVCRKRGGSPEGGRGVVGGPARHSIYLTGEEGKGRIILFKR